MRGVAKFLFILLSIGSATQSLAQRPDLQFEHINTKNGLVKNFVNKTLQDDIGIMWFGTENGLNKFDGSNFSLYQYSPNNNNSLQSNDIRSIYEDKQKNLWIGTRNGLHLYDRKNDNFIRYNNLQQSIEAICEDRFNNLWVSTSNGGLYIVDRISKKISAYTHTDTPLDNIGGFSSLFEDSEGVLWYVNEKEIQIINRLDKTVIKTGLKINSATCIFEDGKKQLWFGSRKDGLFLYDRKLNKCNQYLYNRKDSNAHSKYAIYCITEDHTGKLWIGREHYGLDILDVDRKTFYNYYPNAFDWKSLGSHTIYSFCRDRNNSIWLGTFNGGVSLARVQKFGHFKNKGNDLDGLNHNNILSFCEDRLKNIWVSTDGGGLNYYETLKGKFVHYLHDPKNAKSISNNFVTNVMEDHTGTIWAGFWDGGLDKFNKANNEFMHYRHDPLNPASLVSNNVWKIFEDSDFNLWIGTTNGLDVLNRSTGEFTHYNKVNNGLTENSIFDIFEDYDHNLWVATPHGLNLLNKKDSTFTTFFNRQDDPKSLSDNVILSLFQDSKLRLWICTRNGLNLYNKDTNSFTTYSEKDGLVSNSICSMLEDRKGNLWISTQNGISVFNPDTHSVHNYNAQDGLQDNEFKQLAALKTTRGLFLFGGNNGFNMFNPDNIVSNTYVPPIIFTDFKIFNKSVHTADVDLVITDLQMPEMDGIQLAEMIRVNNASLPVILLSSMGDESKKKYPALFSGMLNKPVKQLQLIRTLQSIFHPHKKYVQVDEQKPKFVLSKDFALKYPLRILIAEDNPVKKKLAARALNKLGYEGIEFAENGQIAVEKSEAQCFDLIFMDIQMPDMDGLEATRLIRSKRYYQPIIIAMTANVMQGDREDCLTAGMNDYISKPVHLETLVAMIEKWALHIKVKLSTI